MKNKITTMAAAIIAVFIVGSTAVLAHTSSGPKSMSLQGYAELAPDLLNKRISLTVSDVEIKNVIRAFSKQSNINVIIGDSIDGTISVMLNNVNSVDALNSILNTRGYSWYAQDSRTVVITSQRISHTFPLRYVNAEDVRMSLEGMVGADGNISVHAPTNSIVVNGTTSLIYRIHNAIRNIDLVPKQVLVEAKIIELTVGNVSNLGIIANYQLGGNTTFQTQGFFDPMTAQGLNTVYINTPHQLEVTLNALSERNDYNLLASPRVLATNNKSAQILVGERLGYRVTTTTQTSTTESIEYLDVGTKLLFTPLISDDGYIGIELHPEISSGVITDGIPSSRTTETSTQVTVKDGETIVIGGLIRKEERDSNKGVPLLKDIPILGIAFRNKMEDIQKKEILIFLTPHILNDTLKVRMLEETKEMEDAVEPKKIKELGLFL